MKAGHRRLNPDQDWQQEAKPASVRCGQGDEMGRGGERGGGFFW